MSFQGFLNPVSIVSSIDSLSASTGALIVAGGVGIAKNLHVEGGNAALTHGTMNSNLPMLNLYNTSGGLANTVGINISPWSLRQGGPAVRLLGVDTGAGDAFFSLRVATGSGPATEVIRAYGSYVSIASTAGSISSTTGAFVVTGGIGIGGALYVGGASTMAALTATGAVALSGQVGITNTTASTSPATGALSINGGFGLVGAMNTSGSITSSGVLSITNTTETTGTSSGALLVAGGIGAIGNVAIGGTLTVTGTVTVPAPVNSSDASTRGYVDANIATAGTGLTKTGTIFSVNASQTQITSVGTLTYLTSSGIVTITNATPSTSTGTGSLVLGGGLGLAGSIFAGGNTSVAGTLAVTGASTFTGAVTVPTATLGTHATTKTYVDSLIVTAGTGLTKTGTVFSVDASQTGITTLGTLTGLLVAGAASFSNSMGITGPVIISDETDSSTSTTGALRVNGGVGIQKSLFIGTNTFIKTTTPDIGEKLAVFGTTAAERVQIFDGDTVATGSRIHFNTGFPGVVSAGGSVLRLQSQSKIEITPTTDSSSPSTGALCVAGGIGVAKSIYVGGASTMAALTATGAVALSGQVGITNTTASTSPATGALSINGGFGLVGAMNTSGSITSSGILSITNTTQTIGTSSGALLVAGGIGAIGNVAIGGTLTVTGTVTVPTPVNLSDASTKNYVDVNVATAGTGLTKTGTTFSVNAAQTQITSVGTLTGLTSSGIVSITNATASTSIGTGSLVLGGGLGLAGSIFGGGNISVGGTLAVTGASTFTGAVTVPTATLATHATTKAYVDSLIVTAGTGLTKTGTVFSVDASQTGITTLGTLTGLLVAGAASFSNSMGITGQVGITNTTASTSPATGALSINGGLGLAGAMNTSGSITSSGVLSITNTTQTIGTSSGALLVAGGIGAIGNVAIGGTLTVTGTVTVPTPVNLSDASTKNYVDINVATAGTGLTKTGTTFSVNAAQTQITSVGTLTGLTSSGIVSITNATPSTSTGTGSLVLGGGLGLAGSIFAGGNTSVAGTLAVTGASTFTGAVIVPTATLGTHPTTKAYVDSLIVSAGTGLTKTGTVFSVNASQTGITTLGTLTGLLVAGAATFSNSMGITGPVIISDGTDSSTSTTGALTVAGGAGIAKSLHIGQQMYIPSTYAINFGYEVAGKEVNAGRMGYNLFTSPFLEIVGAGTATNTRAVKIYDVLHIDGSIQSSSATTGALIVAGGIGIAKNMMIGGYVRALGTVGDQTIGLIADGTASATNATIGLQMSNASGSYPIWQFGQTGSAGGVNAGNAFVWSTTGSTSMTFKSDGTTNIPNPTDTSSTSTGALTVAGGIGITKSLYVGQYVLVPYSGRLTIGHVNNCIISPDVNGGLGIPNSLANDIIIRPLNSAFRVVTADGVSSTFDVLPSGTVAVNTGTDSTSSTDGAFKVSGGVGIAKSCRIGTVLTKGSGTFDIRHPDPEKAVKNTRLRHGFVESPTRGDNIYRYRVTTVEGKAEFKMPDYSRHLNENLQVFVTAGTVLCACRGWVMDTESQRIGIESVLDGEFNVLVIGTRKDDMARLGWDDAYGDSPEYTVPTIDE